MAYDVYGDPYNPVRKQNNPDLGKGNGGGDFEYGKGRDIKINEPEAGVCDGTTEVQQAVVNWDRDDAGEKMTNKDYIQGPYQETSG